LGNAITKVCRVDHNRHKAVYRQPVKITEMQSLNHAVDRCQSQGRRYCACQPSVLSTAVCSPNGVPEASPAYVKAAAPVSGNLPQGGETRHPAIGPPAHTIDSGAADHRDGVAIRRFGIKQSHYVVIEIKFSRPAPADQLVPQSRSFLRVIQSAQE
jgi:hypothetical protein